MRVVQVFRGQRKQGHDGCWETQSASPLWHCEHEEQAQVQWGCCQTSGRCVEGGTAEEAQAKDDREIMPMRTLHAKATSSRCYVGMAIAKAIQLARFSADVSSYDTTPACLSRHMTVCLMSAFCLSRVVRRYTTWIPVVQPSFLC